MNETPFCLDDSSEPEKKVAPQVEYGTLDLRLGDCLELMAGFPDGHFELAIVDPPYGINASNTSLEEGESMGNPIRSRLGKTTKKATGTSKRRPWNTSMNSGAWPNIKSSGEQIT